MVAMTGEVGASGWDGSSLQFSRPEGQVSSVIVSSEWTMGSCLTGKETRRGYAIVERLFASRPQQTI